MDKISVSKVEMYRKCPMQFEFRYIKGIKKPPSGALTLGISVHEAIEHNFKQKIESKKDVKISVLKDVFAEQFDKWDKETDWKEDDPVDAKSSGFKVIDLYSAEVAPKVQPILVEEWIEVNLPGIDELLVGKLDLVDDKACIRDFKTSGKSKPEDDIYKSLQLATYAAGYRAITQEKEKNISLDVLVKTKTPKYQRLEYKNEKGEICSIPDEKIESAMNTISAISKLIQTGIFYPRTDHYGCHKKWCGYWDICKGR